MYHTGSDIVKKCDILKFQKNVYHFMVYEQFSFKYAYYCITVAYI